jgi:hypothetical protein
MERAIQVRKEQDLQLRDSIFQATREVRRLIKFLYLHNIIAQLGPTRHERLHDGVSTWSRSERP